MWENYCREEEENAEVILIIIEPRSATYIYTVSGQLLAEEAKLFNYHRISYPETRKKEDKNSEKNQKYCK